MGKISSLFKTMIWKWGLGPWIGSIGSIASVISLIIAFNTKSNLFIGIGYWIFALSLSFIAFYEAHHRFRESREKENAENKVKEADKRIKEVEKQLQVFYNIDIIKDYHLAFHDLRQINIMLINWRESNISTKPSKDLKKERAVEFAKCLEGCLTHLSNFFTKLHNDIRSFLCIKILIEDSGIKSVEDIKYKTLVRDSYSDWRKQEDGRIYDLLENTAFNYIVYQNNPWYYKSDLLKEIKRNYKNQNIFWLEKKHYRTVAVLPIRAPESLKNNKSIKKYLNIKGFLAIDTEIPNAFEEQPTVYLLGCISDLLYVTFTLLKLLNKKEGRTNG